MRYEYEDDGTGTKRCKDCTAPKGQAHATWCAGTDRG